MLDANKMLQEGIEQVRQAGIEPGNINPEVVINNRAKTRFGLCRRLPNAEYDFEIELNSELLKADKKKAMNTMVHEILHTCDGCMNHGPLWTRYANIMNRKFGYNISRITSYEELGLARPKPKYVVRCDDCGNEAIRFRKSKLITHTHQYACGVCSGNLSLVS